MIEFKQWFPVQSELSPRDQELLLDQSVENLGQLVKNQRIHMLSGQQSVQQFDVEDMFLSTILSIIVILLYR